MQAANDFRVHVGFFRHRKTKRLRRHLGDEGVVSLLTLWAYATENHPDGNLGQVSPEVLADMADWPESHAKGPEAFYQSLLTCGWVDEADGCVILHDWAQHQPWVAGRDKRSASARHAARMRWASEGHAEGNADRCPSPLPSSPTPTSPTLSKNTEGAKAPKRVGPQDQLARDLADRLGSSLNPCRKQVKALRARGWTLEQIRERLDEAAPGMAPWDFSKLLEAGTRKVDWMAEARKAFEEER